MNSPCLHTQIHTKPETATGRGRRTTQLAFFVFEIFSCVFLFCISSLLFINIFLWAHTLYADHKHLGGFERKALFYRVLVGAV